MAEFEPLYTAGEMRAAEARHPGFPGSATELMERAGTQAAQVARAEFGDAARWTIVCGGGSNGGDGRIVARCLRSMGKDVRIVDAKAGETDLGEADVVVDALFGTGFSRQPAPGGGRADRADEREPRPRCSRSTCRRASTRQRGRSRGTQCGPR